MKIWSRFDVPARLSAGWPCNMVCAYSNGWLSFAMTCLDGCWRCTQPRFLGIWCFPTVGFMEDPSDLRGMLTCCKVATGSWIPGMDVVYAQHSVPLIFNHVLPLAPWMPALTASSRAASHIALVSGSRWCAGLPKRHLVLASRARCAVALYSGFDNAANENLMGMVQVRDEQGLKMSKSLGNVLDPAEIIERHSCVALRLTLASGLPSQLPLCRSTVHSKLGCGCAHAALPLCSLWGCEHARAPWRRSMRAGGSPN